MEGLIELLEEAKDWGHPLYCHHALGYRFNSTYFQTELEAILTDSNLTNIDILIAIKKSGIKTKPLEEL